MADKLSILVVNGPNLNLLGERNPDIYGMQTLDDLNEYIRNGLHGIELRLAEIGIDVDLFVSFYQSNHEGDLIDCIQEARKTFDGIVFNPGAYTHYSYALHDAVEAIRIPVIEVHLSDISQREEFRRTSVIAPACVGQVKGMGRKGYIEAIVRLVAKITDKGL
ncbi:MAG: type II 3-dehydroquinate dehydratase [Coriobacteriales bacterium]|jgi:3-dehydroquinate dehydratase-2